MTEHLLRILMPNSQIEKIWTKMSSIRTAEYYRIYRIPVDPGIYYPFRIWCEDKTGLILPATMVRVSQHRSAQYIVTFLVPLPTTHRHCSAGSDHKTVTQNTHPRLPGTLTPANLGPTLASRDRANLPHHSSLPQSVHPSNTFSIYRWGSTYSRGRINCSL